MSAKTVEIAVQFIWSACIAGLAYIGMIAR
jgi:hypothetical protein